MTWIIILIVMILIAIIGGYKKTGEGYSAGRGLFKNSDFDLDDSKKDFSDYEPWEHKNMRK